MAEHSPVRIHWLPVSTRHRLEVGNSVEGNFQAAVHRYSRSAGAAGVDIHKDSCHHPHYTIESGSGYSWRCRFSSQKDSSWCFPRRIAVFLLLLRVHILLLRLPFYFFAGALGMHRSAGVAQRVQHILNERFSLSVSTHPQHNFFDARTNYNSSNNLSNIGFTPPCRSCLCKYRLELRKKKRGE